MTAAAPSELLELWHAIPPSDRAEILEALPNDEAVALELALGPDPEAVAAARAETDDPVAWVRRWLPALMPLEPGPHHRTLLDALEPDGPTGVRLVVGAPRGSGKSTAALTALPIIAAVRRSHRFIVIIRDNLPDAVSSVRGLRALLESPDLAAAYPWIRPLPGEQGEIHLAGGVIIVARSTGSAIRGLNRILPDGTIARPDLVIGDDLEDDESARSSLQTGRLEEWILGTIGQLGGPPGSDSIAPLDLVVLGTTLETNALVSRMLAGAGPFASWRRHRFPAEATVAQVDGDLVAVDSAGAPTSIPVPDGAQAGDRIPLWPAGMPLDYLDRLSDPADELFVGSILYSREYLLRPRQRTDVLFAADRTVWVDDLAARWVAGDLALERDAMGADPAISVREVADWTAVAVTALARADAVLSAAELDALGLEPARAMIVVPYAERRRATPGETLAWIEELAAVWIPAGRVAFEAEGGFAAMADELRRRGKVGVRPVKSGGVDKRTRAVPLSVWHEAHRLAFDSSLRGGTFDLEFHGFTGTGQEEHDDYVDALAHAATYSTNAWRRR